METSPFLEFGPFRLDVANARLLREGAAVPLPPKTFDVLAATDCGSGEPLARQQIEVPSKEQVMTRPGDTYGTRRQRLHDPILAEPTRVRWRRGWL